MQSCWLSKIKQLELWPALQSPFLTANRFLTPTTPVSRPVDLHACSISASRVKQRMLVIGDSITRNVRLESPATVSNIEVNPRVLASCRENQGTEEHTTTSFSKIVIHAGTNSIRMKQSEITKKARTLEFAKKMSWLIVSGPLPMRSNDEMYNRLTSLNCWLARYCGEQGFGFVDKTFENCTSDLNVALSNLLDSVALSTKTRWSKRSTLCFTDLSCSISNNKHNPQYTSSSHNTFLCDTVAKLTQ